LLTLVKFSNYKKPCLVCFTNESSTQILTQTSLKPSLLTSLSHPTFYTDLLFAWPSSAVDDQPLPIRSVPASPLCFVTFCSRRLFIPSSTHLKTTKHQKTFKTQNQNPSKEICSFKTQIEGIKRNKQIKSLVLYRLSQTKLNQTTNFEPRLISQNV
jgi:hypothetical protein